MLFFFLASFPIPFARKICYLVRSLLAEWRSTKTPRYLCLVGVSIPISKKLFSSPTPFNGGSWRKRAFFLCLRPLRPGLVLDTYHVSSTLFLGYPTGVGVMNRSEWTAIASTLPTKSSTITCITDRAMTASIGPSPSPRPGWYPAR